jgi:preprotein translocase subunit YajC
MSLQFMSAFHALGALGLIAAAKSTKSTGSSAFFYILIIAVAGVYLWIRTQRKRQRQAVETQRAVEIGDEVVTTSGIVGKVVGFVGDRVELEIAPGTTVEILRQAMGRRIDPPDLSTSGDGATPPEGGSS